MTRPLRQQHWRFYAYCLMSKAKPLLPLIETPEGKLGVRMCRLNGGYIPPKPSIATTAE